jgi:hypothetical protein
MTPVSPIIQLRILQPLPKISLLQFNRGLMPLAVALPRAV